MLAVTQSAILTDRTKDTQIQTAGQLGQVEYVHKNPQLTKCCSIVKYLLGSMFYVLHVIPSNSQIFF
jgi:hypothetical protein